MDELGLGGGPGFVKACLMESLTLRCWQAS